MSDQRAVDDPAIPFRPSGFFPVVGYPQLLDSQADVISLLDTPGPLPTGVVRDRRRHRLTPPPLLGTGAPLAARPTQTKPAVAVLLPCRNEAAAIAKVVRDFQRNLPEATVYVYDNASTDDTAKTAAAAGAIVRTVPEPGKGNVLRRMFADIEASVYVVADGDDTYDATAAPAMVHRLLDGHLDMVVGDRQEAEDATRAYRCGHRSGNQLLTRSVHWMFGNGSNDMLSGYRVFSRSFVKSFPAVSTGFEIETEMTVHALDLNLPFDEVPTRYCDRPADSASKLRTIPDGIKILTFIIKLWKDYRPMRFFGAHAAACGIGAAAVALAADGQLHAWTPAAFAAATLTGFAMLFLLIAIILDSLGRSRREVKRMLYLAVARHTTQPH